MKPPESFGISQQAKEQMITLKRSLGVMQWNHLCRWAFAISVRDPSPKELREPPADSNVEMTFKTFGGRYDGIYWALLIDRARQDGHPIDPASLATLFRIHIHRGIARMAGDKSLRSCAALAELALS
jgi:DNA sulfur modification protein DndE